MHTIIVRQTTTKLNMILSFMIIVIIAAGDGCGTGPLSHSSVTGSQTQRALLAFKVQYEIVCASTSGRHTFVEFN